MALGQDYMSAGVFDRAERIFLEVVDLGGRGEARSLQELMAIYQQEKAWDKALNTLHKFELVTGQTLATQAAHFHCEIAEQYLKRTYKTKPTQKKRRAIVVLDE